MTSPRPSPAACGADRRQVRALHVGDHEERVVNLQRSRQPVVGEVHALQVGGSPAPIYHTIYPQEARPDGVME
jgi:hypothetical protein